MYTDFKSIIDFLSSQHNIKIMNEIGNEIDFNYCPNCKDHQIDINIDKGIYKCHKCDDAGNIKNLYDSLEGDGEFYKNYIKEDKKTELNLEEISYELQKSLRKTRNKIPLQYLYNYRLYNDETIEKFKIGYADESFKISQLQEKHYHLKNCITFPIFDKRGKIINIKFKQVEKITPEKYCKKKVFNITGFGKSTTNYIKYNPNAERLWIFEGEPDAILAYQVLLNCCKDYFDNTNIISPTAGACSIPKEWNENFFNLPTTVFYDSDIAGQKGMCKLNQFSKNIRQANFEYILIDKEKDFTDLTKKVGEERAFKLLSLLEILAINENKGADIVEELNIFKTSLNKTIFKDLRLTIF